MRSQWSHWLKSGSGLEVSQVAFGARQVYETLLFTTTFGTSNHVLHGDIEGPVARVRHVLVDDLGLRP